VKQNRLLVVEDDEFVQSLLCAYLDKEGYATHRAQSGREMLAALEGDSFDLILLDLGLPDEDGLVLTKIVRSRSSVPIIVLTTRNAVEDRVSALELGADDYVTKPVEPRELALRIRNLIGRHGASPRLPDPGNVPIVIAEWKLDPDARTLVSARRGEVSLTRSEFDLVSAMFRAPDRVLSRDLLLDAISRGGDSPTDRTIDVLVSRLRKKLEHDPAKPELIITVPGLGYKLDRRAGSLAGRGV